MSDTPLPATSSSAAPGLLDSIIMLVARVLLVAMFLPSGIGKITGFDGAVAYATSAGLPMPSVGIVLAIAAELALPVLVILGFQTRLAALGLLIFTAVATYYFHAFWNLQPPARNMQTILFYKNLAVIGGLLLLFRFGPGRFAVSWRS